MTSRICTVAMMTLLVVTTPSHAATDPPAAAVKPPPECATAKNAQECFDTLTKLGKNPFDAFGYVGAEPVYGQSEAPALQPGSVVTQNGAILPRRPNPMTDFLYNWQTLITGGLAIIAAFIGAWAAYHVGNKRKDRLQAQCIAVAISPELLDLKVRHERARKIIGEEFPKIKAQRPSVMTTAVVASILDAKIEIPPLLSRTMEQLYILDQAGPTLLQLVSVTLQYNNMITSLAEQIRQHIDSFNPPEHQKDLSGHLQVIAQNISDAERLITPLHDAATARD
jgi:hypothetical protein